MKVRNLKFKNLKVRNLKVRNLEVKKLKVTNSEVRNINKEARNKDTQEIRLKRPIIVNLEISSTLTFINCKNLAKNINFSHEKNQNK